MGTLTAWLERNQVPLYLGALLLGAVVGLAFTDIAAPAQLAATPVLGVLMYVTFVGVPFAKVSQAVRDVRFLTTALVLNFAVVPVVAFALTRFVAHDQVLLVGVLFVLLTPCVDYVMTFTGLAGGAHERLVAAAPVLMLTQMVLLPVYLWLFVGPDLVSAIDPAPFVQALVFIIVVPMIAAGLTQFAATRSRSGVRLQSRAQGAMVPWLCLTLAVVVAGHISHVNERIGAIGQVVPLYVAFAALMAVLGVAAGKVAGLDVPGTRAITFSSVTRNSLVVLPLVLALPDRFDLAPLVVVTQTLVELVVMVVLVRWLPRLIRSPG